VGFQAAKVISELEFASARYRPARTLAGPVEFSSFAQAVNRSVAGKRKA
jgi:hypothetical protein